MLPWWEVRLKHFRGFKNLQLSAKHNHTRGARMEAMTAYMVQTFPAKFLHG